MFIYRPTDGKIVSDHFTEMDRDIIIQTYPKYKNAAWLYLENCLTFTSCDSELYAKDNEGWKRG